MLRIETQETFPEVPNVAIWGDNEAAEVVYAIPEIPRLRLVNGEPQFKFIKYRDVVGSNKKGAFVFFDVEVAVADADKATILEIWQKRLNDEHARAGLAGQPPQAKLGAITYTRGAVSLLLEEGALIEQIRGVTTPSLYGNNVAAFMLELNEQQSPIFENAMQGKGVSIVGVKYDLYFWASTPPSEVTAWFSASRYYSFDRGTEVEVSGWSEDHYRDDIREYLSTSKSGGVEVQVFPPPATDEKAAEAWKKIKDSLTDWGWRTLQDAMLQEAENALKPVGEENKKASDKVMEQLGGDDLDHLQISINQRQMTDINLRFTDRSPVEWHFAPNGHLPSLTSLVDKDGNPLKWEDYSVLVDPDAFFQELHVFAQVNAPFERLPIHSVEVHVIHDGQPVPPLLVNEIGTGQTTLEGTLINSADDVLHFAAYADKSNKYQHWYEVNFVGESKTFKSKPVDVEATLRDPLVINLDETGVLSLDIKKGDVDFDQIRTAEVVLSYADPAVNVANVGGRFFLDAQNPTAQFQKVIFSPKNNPWTYQVKYTMADDGREIVGPEQTEWGPTLYVNDLFSASRLVLISALGDLKGKIDRIVVDAQYVHPEYDYRVTRQATLRDGTSDEEWRFPVVSETAGVLTFSGQIFYRDGTVETIDEQVPKGNQILVGEVIEEKLKIEVVPDFLFDDPSVRLVSVDLTYTDPKDGSQQTASPKFRPPAAGGPAPASFIWVVDLRDDKARDYSWQAKFFLEGGAVKSIPPTPSSDSTIVPQLSDATA